jgi:AcrR family transcriptional regulator
MSPRPYRLGQRQASVEQTRARILEAARALLTAEAGVAALTLDAVAEQAGVARMTIYYQFASKRGLLEALFDDFAARGLVEPLRAAFDQPEPMAAVDAFVGAFCGFWASNRVALRRIRGLAAVDPEIEQGVRARDQRRREGLRAIVGRLEKVQPIARPVDEAIDMLHALTSFELFDALAGTRRKTEDVVRLVIELVCATLELPTRSGKRSRVQKPRGPRPSVRASPRS